MHVAKASRLLVVLSIGSLFAASTVASAATTVDVSTTVARAGVKRFGLNLGSPNYWDSGQMMKMLVFRNPGFEGERYQSVVRCQSGTATSCVDDNVYTAWPDGFWDGASFEFFWGAAKGRTGTIQRSTAPTGGNGTAFLFTSSGAVPALGDYMVLRKVTAGSGDRGWWPNPGGGSVTTELVDLPPGTAGRQSLRLDVPAGSYGYLSAYFDSMQGQTFLRLNGGFRLSFSAKGAGGSQRLRVWVRRNPDVFLDRTLALSSAWARYDLDFTAAEAGTTPGTVELRFTPEAPATVLLDDVSLVPTGTDPANTTAFRDEVVQTLLLYRPGILRLMQWNIMTDSLDDQIAPVFGRQRAGYTAFGTSAGDIPMGLHEFLELCDLVGAEPWYSFPVTFSEAEMRNLMEYLGGPASTPYGARRAARGRAAPWTDAFARIHLEFGNEAWNSTYLGAAIGYPVPYGNRGSELFGIAKASPYYTPSRFDLQLGGQAGWPDRNRNIHGASQNHDGLALAPYMAGRVDSFGSDEELFGPLFAEPEWWSTGTGFMRQTYDIVQASAMPVPLSVYEVNLHTTQGAISQAALDDFTPSLGAGIALAGHQLKMMRELSIRDQVSFALPGFAFQRDDGKSVRLWGLVRDMGVTDRRRPQYLALALANLAIGGDMLATTHSGDDPTWDQPLVNRVEYPNAHYLQSYAFDDGGRKAVVVFNYHRTSPLDVTFSGPNAPRGAVRLDRLAGGLRDGNEDAENVRTTSQIVTAFDPATPLSLPAHSMTVLRWPLAAGNVATGQGHGPANPNRVRIFLGDGTATPVDFAAYAAGRWGVNVARASLNAAALDELVTGPGPGDVYGPQARGFLRDGTPVAGVNFYAYGTLRFGLEVEGGDVDGDGFSEILTGPGPGAVFGPHVRGFDVDGGAAAPIAKLNFFAYGTLRYGVHLGSSSLDGDVPAEIVSSPGPGIPFGPQLRGWNYDASAVAPMAGLNFNAFPLTQYGARAASGDVTGDGVGDMAAAPGPGTSPGFEPRFRGFSYDGTAVAALPGFDVTASASLRYGGRPGLGEVTGDSRQDLLAGHGPDPGASALVLPFAYDGVRLLALTPFDAYPGSTYGASAVGGAFGY